MCYTGSCRYENQNGDCTREKEGCYGEMCMSLDVMTNKKVKHFKGNEYIVLGSGIHTESKEELVFYKSVETGTIYARPFEMFFEKVPEESKCDDTTQEYRFELADDKEYISEIYVVCPHCKNKSAKREVIAMSSSIGDAKSYEHKSFTYRCECGCEYEVRYTGIPYSCRKIRRIII